MLRFAVGAVLAAVAVSGASAATLNPVSPAQIQSSAKLFTTEWKRDENLQNNGQRGHDIFLRNNTRFTGPSFNLDWAASGAVYDWSLAYDGDAALLTFAGRELALNVSPDGSWNAIQFFIRADSSRFTTSTASVTVTHANGSALATALTSSATNGVFDGIFALTGFQALTSLAGTMAFDFVVAPGASGSPNSALAVNLKALEITPVPLPAAAWLLLAGLGGLGLMARRRAAA